MIANLDQRYHSRLRKGTAKLACWTGAWLIANALLAFGPRFLWDQSVPFTMAGFAFCILVGVGMLFANKNLLRDQDELQQKVQLDAMAITLGALVVIAVPFSLFQAYDLVPFKAGVPALMVLISVTYLVSLIVGLRRYR